MLGLRLDGMKKGSAGAVALRVPNVFPKLGVYPIVVPHWETVLRMHSLYETSASGTPMERQSGKRDFAEADRKSAGTLDGLLYPDS